MLQSRPATAVDIDALVLFSLIWTVGATGDTDGRAAFDAYFRSACFCSLLLCEMSTSGLFLHLSPVVGAQKWHIIVNMCINSIHQDVRYLDKRDWSYYASARFI